MTAAASVSASLGKETMQVLMVGLQNELFAVDIGLVREILDPVPVTEVPGERGFLSGIINVRGKVVPVADLRKRFDMDIADTSIDTRFIVTGSISRTRELARARILTPSGAMGLAADFAS